MRVDTLRPAAGTDEGSQVDANTLEVMERLEVVFERLGSATNYKFDEAEARVLQGLLQPDGRGFEGSHTELGRLLGYEAGKVEGDATPDPWWRPSAQVCFVFEDHAGAGAGGLLDATKARQAATHSNWVKQNVPLAPDAEIVQILITPVTRAATGALPHLAAVLTWPLDDFRLWATNALATLRELKRTFREASDIAWRAEALDALDRANISPATLKARVARVSAAVAWTGG